MTDPVCASCTCTTLPAGAMLVRLAGELDVGSAPNVEAQLTASYQPGRRHVVIDLREVDFIDSSGIRVILQVLARSQSRENLVVVYPRARVARRALETVGLERIVRMVEAVDDALDR